ncbi:MAG: hypothetical protein SWE60_13515, partial [Thermodesulfobacteriota bacterium]|nr:hypothetical protein [Thermodesulfobacteriota bacterium]
AASIALKGSGGHYASFLKRGDERSTDVDIKIRVEIGNMPHRKDLEKVFSAGQAWSMYRDGQDYWMALTPPAFKAPIWMAKMDRTFTRVVVRCGEELVSKEKGEIQVSDPVCYPLDQILLMHVLAQRRGALIHAAGIGINGMGYLFPGRSGAGKTTLTRQFAVREDLELLSDDRMVIRGGNGAFRAFGTPWPGDAGIAQNKSLPLLGIFFITHGASNRIKDMTPQQALERLLPVTSIPWYDGEMIPPILSFCEDLISHVPVYELFFKPGIDLIAVFEAFVGTES